MNAMLDKAIKEYNSNIPLTIKYFDDVLNIIDSNEIDKFLNILHNTSNLSCICCGYQYIVLFT